MDPSKLGEGLVHPTADEFWAIYRDDTKQVLWFCLTEEEAEEYARLISLMPEMRDVPIGYTIGSMAPEDN